MEVLMDRSFQEMAESVAEEGKATKGVAIEGLHEYYQALSEAANQQSVLDAEMAAFAETVKVAEIDLSSLPSARLSAPGAEQ